MESAGLGLYLCRALSSLGAGWMCSRRTPPALLQEQGRNLENWVMWAGLQSFPAHGVKGGQLLEQLLRKRPQWGIVTGGALPLKLSPSLGSKCPQTLGLDRRDSWKLAAFQSLSRAGKGLPVMQKVQRGSP